YRCLVIDKLRTATLSPLFPYTTLFRSTEWNDSDLNIIFGLKTSNSERVVGQTSSGSNANLAGTCFRICDQIIKRLIWRILPHQRSEEHTSELQSRENLVCRLLLEKKKN